MTDTPPTPAPAIGDRSRCKVCGQDIVFCDDGWGWMHEHLAEPIDAPATVEPEPENCSEIRRFREAFSPTPAAKPAAGIDVSYTIAIVLLIASVAFVSGFMGYSYGRVQGHIEAKQGKE